MAIITDSEFGDITVRLSDRARSIRIRMGTNGKFVVSAPRRARLKHIASVIDSSREALRDIVRGSGSDTPYQDSQAIGKNHHIAVVSTGMVSSPAVAILREKLVVKLPHTSTIDDAAVQSLIKEAVIKIYRREARQHLPQRLEQLAGQDAFYYQKLRFSHAAGRWGSCSSTGTISLNIALMKLPDELIDYVLIHELCHTVHMNHSRDFWALVESHDPHFRLHRRQLKLHSPNV